MLYILKNHRTSIEGEWKYFIFDSEWQTRSEFTAMPEMAKEKARMFQMKAISPLYAKQYFEFKAVALEDFMSNIKAYRVSRFNLLLGKVLAVILIIIIACFALGLHNKI
jgi:hypothetical protein